MLDPVTAAVGRRAVLRLPVALALGGATAGALGGCSSTGPAPAGSAPSHDARLLAEAAALTDGAIADLRTATRRVPALAPRLAPVVGVHRAHRDVLASRVSGVPPVTDAAPPGSLSATGGPARTLAVVAGQEELVAGRLAALAAEADSGLLARVLASGSAAVAAVAVGLSHRRPPGPPPVLVVDPPALPQTASDSPSWPPDGASGAEARAALQEALAAEHAATWTLELLGARTSRSAEPALAAALTAAFVAHRDRREVLASLLQELGEEPVPAAANYVLPDAAAPARVRGEAAAVESRCAGWWAGAVAATTDATRVLAVAALRDTAVRALGLRGEPEAFPGAAELADR